MACTIIITLEEGYAFHAHESILGNHQIVFPADFEDGGLMQEALDHSNALFAVWCYM